MDLLLQRFMGKKKTVSNPFCGITQIGATIADEYNSWSLKPGQSYKQWETKNFGWTSIPQAVDANGHLLPKTLFKY